MASPILLEGAFGWVHPGASRRGAVLCPPFGQEAEFSYRKWRDLAEALAGAGLTTVRLHFSGLGDSPGDEDEPGRLAAWIGDIRRAAQRLRDEHGVEEVVLVGLRFGATLAAAAAREIEGVNGLVLLAPLGSGPAYLRDLTMTARIAHGLTIRQGEELSVAGVTYTRETLADLAKFRPFAGNAEGLRSLTLVPPGLPLDPAVEAWAKGGPAEHAEFAGYSDFMQNADYAIHPTEAFAQVARWAAAGLDARSTAAALHGDGTGVVLELPSGREEVVTIPGTAPLFGLLSLPKRPQRDAPAVLFMNTGATSHQGTGRMWVALARRFAAMGFASLRFDVGGVGDTPDRPVQVDPVLQVADSLQDVKAALNFLEEKGYGQFILAGFCRGSQLATLTALRDRRVRSQVLIGPPVYFWAEPPLHNYPKSAGGYVDFVKRKETWTEILRGEISLYQLVRGAFRMVKRWTNMVERRRKAAATAAQIRQLAARGVDTLMVYGDRDHFLPGVEEYFFSKLSKLDRMLGFKVVSLPDTDHLFLTRRDRDLLVGVVSDFVSAHGAAPSPGQLTHPRWRRNPAPAVNIGGGAAA